MTYQLMHWHWQEMVLDENWSHATSGLNITEYVCNEYGAYVDNIDNLIFRGPNSLSEQRPETGDGM